MRDAHHDGSVGDGSYCGGWQGSHSVSRRMFPPLGCCEARGSGAHGITHEPGPACRERSRAASSVVSRAPSPPRTQQLHATLPERDRRPAARASARAPPGSPGGEFERIGASHTTTVVWAQRQTEISRQPSGRTDFGPTSTIASSLSDSPTPAPRKDVKRPLGLEVDQRRTLAEPNALISKSTSARWRRSFCRCSIGGADLPFRRSPRRRS